MTIKTNRVLDINTGVEFVDALRMIMAIEKVTLKHKMTTENDEILMKELEEKYEGREFKKYIYEQFTFNGSLMYIGRDKVARLMRNVASTFSIFKGKVSNTKMREFDLPEILGDDFIIEDGICMDEMLETLAVLFLQEKMSYKMDEEDTSKKMLYLIDKNSGNGVFYSRLCMTNSLRLDERYVPRKDFIEHVQNDGKLTVREAGFTDREFQTFMTMAQDYCYNLVVPEEAEE